LINNILSLSIFWH